VNEISDERIAAFKVRIDVDGREFCESLFEYATIRLLSHKYAYYVLDKNYISDIAYDGEERSWYVMGRALGLLSEDQISPCIDFDSSHALAPQAIELAIKLTERGSTK
jgi:hypothetical protein